MIQVFAALMWFATAVVHGQQGEVRIRAARVLDGTGQVLTNATVVVRGVDNRGDRNVQLRTCRHRPRAIDAAPGINRRALAHRLALWIERPLRASGGLRRRRLSTRPRTRT